MSCIHYILVCDPNIPNKLCLFRVRVRPTKSPFGLVVPTAMNIPAAVTDGNDVSRGIV